MMIMNPLISIFQHDYHLNSFACSFLSSLSILCFAGAGLLMPLVAKIRSTERIIAFSLTAVAISIFIRAIGNLPIIFLTSVIIGLAVAVLNFSLPVWVKEFDAEHSGLLTGVYITVMGIFASAAVAFAVPLSNLTRWSWRFAMVPLIVLGAFSSIWWLIRVRGEKSNGQELLVPTFHRSTFRSRGAWSIAIFFGIQAFIGYGTVTWFPTIFISKGFTSNDAGYALAAAGLIGALISLAAPHYALKFRNLRATLIGLSIMLVLGLIGVIVDHGWHLIMWLIFVNIALSVTFPLCLMLAVTRGGGAEETRSLSIMSQSVGYAIAFFGPGIVGATYDLTHNWNTALILPIVLSIFLAIMGYFAATPERIRLE
jgi:CP family cyanate transporter-like MFS transporter